MMDIMDIIDTMVDTMTKQQKIIEDASDLILKSVKRLTGN